MKSNAFIATHLRQRVEGRDYLVLTSVLPLSEPQCPCVMGAELDSREQGTCVGLFTSPLAQLFSSPDPLGPLHKCPVAPSLSSQLD